MVFFPIENGKQTVDNRIESTLDGNKALLPKIIVIS